MRYAIKGQWVNLPSATTTITRAARKKGFLPGIVCAAYTRCLIIIYTKQHPNTADSFKNLRAQREKTFFFFEDIRTNFMVAQKPESKIVIDKYNTRLTLERREKIFSSNQWTRLTLPFMQSHFDIAHTPFYLERNIFLSFNIVHEKNFRFLLKHFNNDNEPKKPKQDSSRQKKSHSTKSYRKRKPLLLFILLQSVWHKLRNTEINKIWIWNIHIYFGVCKPFIREPVFRFIFLPIFERIHFTRLSLYQTLTLNEFT